MPDLAKSEMRTMRRLAEAAWDCELREVLGQLQAAFDAWRRGEISSFQLSDRIHEFHDGDARELYKTYSNLNPSLAVAQALAHGAIKPADIPDDILAKLTPVVLACYSEELRRSP